MGRSCTATTRPAPTSSSASSPALSISVIHGLAGTAAAAGDVVRAARLEAAAMHLEQDLGRQASVADSGIHRRFLNGLRASTDPSDWEVAAREGVAMSLDQAIALALDSRRLQP